MPRSLNKTLFRIHGWLGLTVGLLLFVVCFSGTVATVSSEIDWLFNPAIRATPVATEAERSWERWYQSVSEAYPDTHIVSISAPPAEGWAVDAAVAFAPRDVRHVYLHPDTAEVQGDFSQFNVARFFRSFHKQFYIYPGSMPHGGWVVTPFAIVLLLSVATGFLFYKIRWKDLFFLRRGGGTRGWLSTFHRAAGVWMLAFSIIFGVTGLWYFTERVIVDAGLPMPGAEALSLGGAVEQPDDAERVNLDRIVATANDTFPALQVQTVFFSYRPGSAITVFGEADAILVRRSANQVQLNPYTGEVLARQDAVDLPPFARLVQTMDPLHFGDFGGLPTKLIWLVAGLLISASVLSGPYLWLLRLRQGGAVQTALRPATARGALAFTISVLLLATYGSIVNIGDAISHAAEPGLVPVYVWLVVGGFVAVTILVATVWLTVLTTPPSSSNPSPRMSATYVGAQ